MPGKRRNRIPVEHLDDRELLERAARDDADAVRELHRRAAPSAWGLALAVCGTPNEAAAAVRDGFVATVAAVRDGSLPRDESFRSHVLAATRTAAASRGTDLAAEVDNLLAASASSNDALLTDAARAFGELPERERSALWLADIVLLADDQLALPLADPDTDAVVSGARDALHQRLQQRLAATVADPECVLVTDQLSALLSGTIDDLSADAVHDHLSVCAACRVRREQLVSATDRLSALAPHPPAELERASIDQWRTDLGLATGNTAPNPVVTIAAASPPAASPPASPPAVGDLTSSTADAARFDAPEPALERLIRTVSEPGPVPSSPNRRKLVGAVAGVLVVVGGLAVAAHHAADVHIRTAQGQSTPPTAQFATDDGTGSTTTLAPPVTLPDLALSVIPGPVLPAGSGPATAGTATTPAPTSAPTTAPKKSPTPTTAQPTTTTAPAPTTTVPATTTTTARHCTSTLLNIPGFPCMTWSS